jgi:hypothetical protein
MQHSQRPILRAGPSSLRAPPTLPDVQGVANDSHLGEDPFIVSNPLVELRGPTDDEKRVLSHLSPLMLSSGSSSRSSKSGGKKKKRTRLTPLAVDGRVYAQMFNQVAGRPYPNFSLLDQEIRIVDTYYVPAFLVTSASVVSSATSTFVLSSFTSFTQYTNAFDQYKIYQIECWLDLSGNQDASLGELVTVVDLDDGNSITGPSAILDKQGALVSTGAPGRYHRWAPHVAVAEYSGAFTSYGNVPSTWIDSLSPNVQHFGFKAAGGVGVIATYNLTVRAVIGFRAPGI